MIKFSIITPTLFRADLKRNIESVQSQKYETWQHIVVLDGEDRFDPAVMEYFDFQRSIFLPLPKGFNNVGNTPRHVASYFVNGDYVLYLDEDDYYINETLTQLAAGIQKLRDQGIDPDWGVFKAQRFGQEFFSDPPGHSMTVSCQIFHKPKIKDKDIRWTTRDAYCADGELIEELKLLSDPVRIETVEPLVCVDVSHGGRRD